MTKRRSNDRRPGASRGDDIFKRRSSTVKCRRRPDGRWELAHPSEVLETADDLDDVRQMIEAGEIDVAIDELRWLIELCRDSIEAHYLLGEIAFEERDFRLARGHFGYAFELGYGALPLEGVGGKLAYGLPANKPLLEAAKGLAWCLNELEKREAARAVARELLAWDAADPLGARSLLEKWDAEARNQST